MRILVAADSFKDALPASAVCAAIAAGLKQRDSEISVTEFPLADGGEGTCAILAHHLNLDILSVETVDALDRPIRAQLGLSRDKSVAVIELAQASGLQLLCEKERNPLHTSTTGTGRLIAAAINYGAQKIVLSIGGSATNDAGIGIAAALGWRFVDQQDRDVTPIGGKLLDVRRIVPPATRSAIPVNVLCDVSNPLFGVAGAAHVFAKQKGASDADIDVLDAGLRHIAALVQEVKKAYDLSGVSPEAAGGGAAGGVGYGAMVFLNATLHRGIDYLLDITHFDTALKSADLVITGEGKLDTQTLSGKVIRGVCQRAERQGVPVVALCGQLSVSDAELHSIGLRAAYCINDTGSMANALPRTAERLTYTAARILLHSGRVARM
jgi:glycerate kinase